MIVYGDMSRELKRMLSEMLDDGDVVSNEKASRQRQNILYFFIPSSRDQNSRTHFGIPISSTMLYFKPIPSYTIAESHRISYLHKSFAFQRGHLVFLKAGLHAHVSNYQPYIPIEHVCP